MDHRLLTRLAAGCALIMAGGCAVEETAPYAVEDAVVTLPAVSGRPGALYFTLRSGSAEARLAGLESPRVGRIELHRTVSENDRTRMEPLDDARFGPAAPLVFEPGGSHAMLFEIDPTVRVGDTLSVTFRIEPGPPVTAEVPVRGPGDVGHVGH